MDIHIAQRVVNASADKVSVIVIANYSGDEQQVLEATQNWHTPCVKKRYSFEKSMMWRGTAYFQAKYCDLVVPGVLIEDFTLEYAGKFEQKFRREVEPEIHNNLFEIVRKYQLAIRDARFGTSSSFSSFAMPPMIDVTPVRPTLPPPPMNAPMPFAPAPPQPLPTFANMQKPSLRSIPIGSYSRINLLNYADPNMTAPRGERANVQKMTWHFLDPEHEDDHSIKLFLSFSDEDIGIIERFGMDDDPVVTEPVFSDEAVERLKQDQAAEIAACRDPQIRGMLISEHKEQLRIVREEKRDIYLADLTNNPFIKVFKRRSDAMQAQRRLEAKLTEFRNELEKNRKRLYER